MTTTSDGHPPFLFIVGCGRSGTSVLRRVLDGHSQLAVAHEGRFVAPLSRRRARYERDDGFDVEAFAADLLVDPAVRGNLGLSVEDVRAALDGAPVLDYPDAVRRVFAFYAARQGKPRYGDKMPAYVLRMPALADLFPEARFVHIIRDGRDVALSYQSVAWGPTTAEEAAIRWRGNVRRGRRDGRRLGADRYREVRYEELVADPEPVLRSLCEFLDLAWDDAMLHHHVAAGAVVAATRFPGAHQRLLLPPTRGLRDWRRDMPERDVAGFEAIAGDLLDELGYGRATGPSSVPEQLASRARIVADGLRRAWTQARAGSVVLARGLIGRR
jgi:hypothetical protein